VTVTETAAVTESVTVTVTETAAVTESVTVSVEVDRFVDLFAEGGEVIPGELGAYEHRLSRRFWRP
jgi:hypothetical protein